ncbi:MAG TPA: hypothetical protein VHD57_05860 [Vicinamibacterales bacterium]|jgi:hypothetical protein|nr:hypothetical protein [Vicinamibacterales bacterium]
MSCSSRCHETRWIAGIAFLAFVAGIAPPAAAQFSPSAAVNAVTTLVRGVDSAYDPDHGVYLLVGAQGAAFGVFVNSAGVPLGSMFYIKPPKTSSDPYRFDSYPRAQYSHELGGFLVTWVEETQNPSALHVHDRTVTYVPATPSVPTLGPAEHVVSAATAWGESGAAIGYSPTSQRFLVAWKGFPPDTQLHAQLVDLTGAPVGSTGVLSTTLGRDPGVAWNPDTNQFGVSFSGESSNTGYSALAIVSASDASQFTRHTFNATGTAGQTITDLAYNPQTHHYVMTWFDVSSLSARIAEFDSSGNLLATGTASSKLGSYDALSLAYSAASQTFALVGLNRSTDGVMADELNSRGYRFAAEQIMPTTALPARYTRVSSEGAAGAHWDISYAGGSGGTGLAPFVAITNQAITSATVNGGPAGDYSTPPPSGGSSSGGSGTCTSVKPGDNWTCSNGNWLPPSAPPSTGGSSGSSTPPPSTPPPSTGCTTIKPGPTWTCSNGNWLPPGSAPPSTGGSSSSSTPPPSDPPPASTNCTTIKPGANWTCSNGNWLPPGMAPAGGSTGGSSSSSGGTTGCTSQKPATGNWTCVNGGWVPNDSPLLPQCPSVQPGPTWVCKSGNWLPPDSPLLN